MNEYKNANTVFISNILNTFLMYLIYSIFDEYLRLGKRLGRITLPKRHRARSGVSFTKM